MERINYNVNSPVLHYTLKRNIFMLLFQVLFFTFATYIIKLEDLESDYTIAHVCTVVNAGEGSSSN